MVTVWKRLGKRPKCHTPLTSLAHRALRNTEITDMLSFYLENDSFECKVVNDGKEGLQAIKSDDFDLALLDLAMPEFSGMDIINSLRKDNLLDKRRLSY